MADDTLHIDIVAPLATMTATTVSSFIGDIGRHACVGIVSCCIVGVI